MKKQIAVFFSILSLFTQLVLIADEQAPQPQPQQQQDFDPTPHVLQNFGGMLISFFDMIGNPNDQKHVAGCVSDMVQGMINIGHIGMRRSKTELTQLCEELEAELLEFFTSEEGKRYIYRWKESISNRTRAF